MSTFQEIIKGEIPVLVDFYAEWCAPCKTMNPILKNIKKQFGDELKIIKINIDNNQQVASKFQVRGIPTFILFKNNEVKWRQSGIIEERNFIETIKSKIN
ncbi:MAG: thioredoxin [Crocinitomicaceae bacterium]|nr:thioredoxin [Crocinitomicaceae bacterium]|tara:strand:+ start:239 stop:538 length:300 start_codon:yes stop_codon:yes gene_type:complete